MKVSKFTEKADTNPWMWRYFSLKRSIYGFHRGDTGKRLQRLRDYVRCNIEFVAFRPFDTLNQMDKKSERFEHLHSRTNSSLDNHGVRHCVEFEVLYHVSSESPWHHGEQNEQDTPFFLSRSTVHGEINPTVGQMLQRTIVGTLEHPYNATELHLDAVVKRSYRFSTLVQDTLDERFEIFLVPKGWVPEWMKTDRRIQELVQKTQIWVPGLPVPERMKPKAYRDDNYHSKWLRDESLGPIIPGTLRFA